MTKPNDDKTRTHVALTKGSMVSHYRIVEKIGAGGMGEVYLAEDRKLKRKVALKFLTVDRNNSSSELQQFIQEAQAAARLQHPNIITVHEVSEHQGVPYISMAYIEGLSLGEHAANRSLPLAEIIEIAMQVANGLAAAHDKGVTHRDLKPGNIMIDQSGSVRIVDFGLAILSNIESAPDPDATRTSTPIANRIAGTISYMAPEQLLGQKLDSMVDIFALGVILYELITEVHPFSADSVQEISACILRDTPDDLSLKRVNVPYDLKRIVNRCLAKKPDKRFQTARDVSNELEELASELKRETAITLTDEDQPRQGPALVEESFVIDTNLVRKLSHKDPRMIGSRLAYIDNGMSSDTLIIYLHGIGNDHRQFSELLEQLPFRAISLSLFGFDPNAQLRTPLGLEDHSTLLQAVIKDICNRLRPRNIVLAGYSSGADHVLHLLSSEEFADISVTGLLSLGCNVQFDDCYVSSKLATLNSGDEIQILATIKEFYNVISSMDEWILLHGYLLTAFTKFGTDTVPLRQYATDIMAPFKSGSLDQFSKWYKVCTKRVPHVRFVFDTDGYKTLDILMHQHLENDILGHDFRQETMLRVPCGHMALGQTENTLKLTLEFMKLLGAK